MHTSLKHLQSLASESFFHRGINIHSIAVILSYLINSMCITRQVLYISYFIITNTSRNNLIYITSSIVNKQHCLLLYYSVRTRLLSPSGTLASPIELLGAVES